MAHTRKHLSLLATLILATVAADPARAGDVTCSDMTLLVANATVPVTATVPAQALLAQCQSATGAQLYLVMPSADIEMTLEPGAEGVVTFTVQNAEGDQASATVNVKRN